MFHTYREGSKEGSTDLLLEEIHFPYWAVSEASSSIYCKLLIHHLHYWVQLIASPLLASSYIYNGGPGAFLMNWWSYFSFTLSANKSQSGILSCFHMGVSIKFFTAKIHFGKNHVKLPYQQFLSAMLSRCILFSKRTKNLLLEGRVEKALAL